MGPAAHHAPDICQEREEERRSIGFALREDLPDYPPAEPVACLPGELRPVLRGDLVPLKRSQIMRQVLDLSSPSEEVVDTLLLAALRVRRAPSKPKHRRSSL